MIGLGKGEGEEREERWKEVGMEGINRKESRVREKLGFYSGPSEPELLWVKDCSHIVLHINFVRCKHVEVPILSSQFSGYNKDRQNSRSTVFTSPTPKVAWCWDHKLFVKTSHISVALNT